MGGRNIGRRGRMITFIVEILRVIGNIVGGIGEVYRVCIGQGIVVGIVLAAWNKRDKKRTDHAAQKEQNRRHVFVRKLKFQGVFFRFTEQMGK